MLDPHHEDGAAGSAAHEATDCCRPPDPRIARHFDRRMREAAAAGAMPEMVDVSRGLLGLLDDVAHERPTLLELGSGSGALTVALLERGAARADGVDLSAESVATARRRADGAGVGSRASFRVGDGAQVALEPHDWVVLDRVICCYAHVDRLLANSIGAAAQRYAFSVPHVRGWRGLLNRLQFGAENATNRLRGRPCPGYLHDIGMIERHLGAAGFRRLRHRTVGRWYAAVFERPATDSGQIARSDSVS
jgi:magnesium-protoporphyrin O-methyltransferase